MKNFIETFYEDTKERKLITKEKVKEAIKELRSTSQEEVEKATAIKWGARYLAAKSLGLDPTRYKDEALEHASLTTREFMNQIFDEIGESE